MYQKYLFFKLILIAFIFSHLFYSLKSRKSNQEIFFGDNEVIHMKNYSFYNSLDYPLISIILDFEKLKLDYLTFMSYIKSLLKQTIKDIEIIIYFYYQDFMEIYSLKNCSLIDKRIYLHAFKNNNKIENILTITNSLKGKFMLLIEHLIKFQEDELSSFYNFTKGKINNIFNLTSASNYELNLIRVKILRELVDNKENFKNFQELIYYIKSIPEPKMTYIPISFAPNDKYLPLAYTSMISILSSRNYYTYIDFYLVISNDFSSKNFIILESLFEQFFYFNITYIYMDNRYQNAFVHRYITNQAYFRFSLGNLLPNLNKLIYLDADTIVFKDLSNVYNLNFRGKIFLFKGLCQNKKDKEQIRINSGISLFNLKKMREMKIEEKALKILNSGFKHPTLHDQAVINTFFYKYVGLFPPEFNVYLLNISEVNNLISKTDIYDRDKLLFSLKYPTIRHYKGDKKNLNEDWFFFARKSKYFQKISLNYSNVYNFSIF